MTQIITDFTHLNYLRFYFWLGCNNNPITYKIFNFERIFIYNESFLAFEVLLLNPNLSLFLVIILSTSMY